MFMTHILFMQLSKETEAIVVLYLTFKIHSISHVLLLKNFLITIAIYVPTLFAIVYSQPKCYPWNFFVLVCIRKLILLSHQIFVTLTLRHYQLSRIIPNVVFRLYEIFKCNNILLNLM